MLLNNRVRNQMLIEKKRKVLGILQILLISGIAILSPASFSADPAPAEVAGYTLEAGHPSLSTWLLPAPVSPPHNQPTASRIALGQQLFFDKRLSGSGTMSCGTCHDPQLGWADGHSTAIGANGKKLSRATPTLVNVAYNHLQMWDGRFSDLETQAAGPITNPDEMDLSADELVTPAIC